MSKVGVFLVGYSGHAFVACDIFLSMGMKPSGYFDNERKIINPYLLEYLGSEKDGSKIALLQEMGYFVAIGDNEIRKKVIKSIYTITLKMPVNAIHKNASISATAVLGKGVMIGNGAVVNACSKIGHGVICNTQVVVEHECEIGEYSHIAPGAILCGNIKVGKQTFIGAGAVVKQGVSIGDNVVVGAGTVVIKDIPNDSKVVGNPQKFI